MEFHDSGVQNIGFRVQGSGFRFQGQELKVEGLELLWDAGSSRL